MSFQTTKKFFGLFVYDGVSAVNLVDVKERKNAKDDHERGKHKLIDCSHNKVDVNFFISVLNFLVKGKEHQNSDEDKEDTLADPGNVETEERLKPSRHENLSTNQT